MRRTCHLLACAILAAGAVPAAMAQAGHDEHKDCPMRSGAAVEPSPYAGMESRAIKALSDEDQQKLLAGHGMGMALAAELNSYPGPKHVLELADRLELSEEQVDRTRAIFHGMRDRAQALGRQIIDAEAALDRQFSEATIDEARLAEAIREIGRLEAELRLAHLKAHLEMRAALTPAQNKLYDELRGYRVAAAAH